MPNTSNGDKFTLKRILNVQRDFDIIITILNIIHRPVFYFKKYNILDTAQSF
jgi:hypothetical protein